MRSAGSVELVAVHGPLIGVVPGAEYVSTRVTLTVGDKLVLYTDGLADARAPDVVLSDLDLAALLEEGHDFPGERLAEFLESRATGDSDARDDIVIVVLEAVGPTGDALSVHHYAAATS